jgi:hypothetical protein
MPVTSGRCEARITNHEPRVEFTPSEVTAFTPKLRVSQANPSQVAEHRSNPSNPLFFSKNMQSLEKNGDEFSLLCKERRKSAQVIENKGAQIGLFTREESKEWKSAQVEV